MWDLNSGPCALTTEHPYSHFTFFFLFYFYLCLFYAKWSLCHKILFSQFLLGYLFFLFSFLFWLGKLFLFHENHFNVEGNSHELTQPWALGGHRCALVLRGCGRHRHTLGAPFTCCSGTRSLSFSTVLGMPTLCPAPLFALGKPMDSILILPGRHNLKWHPSDTWWLFRYAYPWWHGQLHRCA